MQHNKQRGGFKQAVLDIAWPVLTFRCTDDPTDPNTLYPWATFVQIKGVVLGAIDTGDTDTNVKTSFNQSAGTLIGSKYLQIHNHYVTTWNYYANTPQTGTKIPKTSDNADGSTTATYTGNEGSGDAQNIQPTRLTYMWQRTA